MLVSPLDWMTGVSSAVPSGRSSGFAASEFGAKSFGGFTDTGNKGVLEFITGEALTAPGSALELSKLGTVGARSCGLEDRLAGYGEETGDG